MLDYEAADDGSTIEEIQALDNGHLYAWGQRVKCTNGEWVLADRLCDALDIIEVLLGAIKPLTSNDYAYAGTWSKLGLEHNVKLSAISYFLRSGVIPVPLLDAASDWRKDKS